jgi:eukaryotic-like serine/threonine-protein kinase
VVHRDVKPANILLSEGRAARGRLRDRAGGQRGRRRRLTETGLSLGTPHYMSPSRRPATGGGRRSDVYALGCVLYEMLAGEPPFTGSTAQAVLVRILTEEPRPVTDVRRTVPPHVAAVIGRSLEKLPADRFPSAEAFAGALRDTSFRYLAGAPTAPARGVDGRTARQRRTLPPWALAAGGAVLVLALLAAGLTLLGPERLGEPPPPSPWVTRVPLPIDGSSLRGPPTLSADGRQIAWATTDGIHVRSLDGLDARTVPGTRGATSPFFSPDGGSLGFSVEGKLHTVTLDGRHPRAVSDSVIHPEVVWGEDGWIYANLRGSGTVVRVRQDGLATEAILSGIATERFVPMEMVDGGRVLIGTLQARVDPVEETVEHIAVLDLESGVATPLLRGQLAQHEPLTDHLVFLNGTVLMTVGFDPVRAEVTGDPFVMAENIGAFGLARDGTLWYVDGPIGGNIPVVVNARGQSRDIMPELSDGEMFYNAYFSPDGGRLVLSLTAEGADRSDIWTYELPAGPRTQLTYDGGRLPAWSLDGRFILFVRDDGVYRVRADASAPPERMLEAEGIHWLQPTPDGGIVFERFNGTDLDVGAASLRGDAPRILVEGPANERDPAVSPDGRWLAYESDETGRREVYVMPFGDSGRGRQVSVAGGNNPLWSHDGETLYFRNEQDEFEAIRIGTGADLEVLGRSVLFDVARLSGRFHPAPGDSLFVARRSGGPRSDARIILVRNWARELAARADAVRVRRARP